MRSWEVRLAATLAWLGAVPGVFCFYVAYKAFTSGNDMLLIVMPIVGSAALIGGFVIVSAAAAVAIGLHAGKPAARLQALVGGLCIAGCGLFALAAEPFAGLLLILYGGTMAWLLLSAGAVADLGPFRDAVPRQPAPWGGTPGTGLWSDEPQQQGPWSPPPTTLPWLAWKGSSGPRPPWWQTWQAGLAQGIPLWELIALVLALLGFGTGLVVLLMGLSGSAYLGTLGADGGGALVGLLLVAGAIGVVTLLEQRLRQRLEGRADGRFGRH
jgi:hypothetical protein